MEPTEPVLDSQGLNDELLEPIPDPQDVSEAPPKRNTKGAIIEKILQLHQDEGIPLEHSNTKLKRMSKKELAILLGSMIEQGVKKEMARAVGSPDTSDRNMAIASLRMLHDLLANCAEKGANMVLNNYDYECTGFTQGLQEPQTSAAIDGCLAEIAETSPEVLQYIESPYSRLMIAWAGSAAFSIKKSDKKGKRRYNAAYMESQAPRGQVSVRGSRGRGATHGEKHADLPSVRTV